MNYRVGRKGSGFTRAGKVEPGRMEMPKRRARELQYRHLWTKAAGPEIASRLRFVRVEGRTLVLAAEEAQWSRQVRSLLPKAAARFAESAPGVEIRRFRVVAPDADGKPRRIEQGRIDGSGGLPPTESLRRVEQETVPSAGSVPDIRKIAAEYLARHGGNRSEHVDET